MAETIGRERIEADTLTVHADRGSSMASKPVALLLADLGVTKTHARPRQPNDNPYSEAQFKTLKYSPDVPRTVRLDRRRPRLLPKGSSTGQDMRVIFGVGYHTATDVHHHRAQALREHRADVLLDAYLDYPERFVRKIPAPPELPTAAWINPPPPPDTKEENQFRSNGTEGPPRQRTATSDNVAGHNESQVVLSQNG